MPVCSLEPYEILLDEPIAVAVIGGPIPWCQDTTWVSNGLHNSLFPNGQIPMKRVMISAKDEPDHSIAMKYVVMAHRSKSLDGPPHLLVRITMNQEAGLAASLGRNGSDS